MRNRRGFLVGGCPGSLDDIVAPADANPTWPVQLADPAWLSQAGPSKLEEIIGCTLHAIAASFCKGPIGHHHFCLDPLIEEFVRACQRR